MSPSSEDQISDFNKHHLDPNHRQGKRLKNRRLPSGHHVLYFRLVAMEPISFWPRKSLPGLKSLLPFRAPVRPSTNQHQNPNELPEESSAPLEARTIRLVVSVDVVYSVSPVYPSPPAYQLLPAPQLPPAYHPHPAVPASQLTPAYPSSPADLAEPASSTETFDNFYTPANKPFYTSGQYHDLDYTKREIRLLEFLPSTQSGPLQLRIVGHCSINDSGVDLKYCAISYYAGDARNSMVILVNGIEFNVFANLEHALRQLFSAFQRGELPDKPRLFWADQICINQSNAGERSHQVQYMRTIYQNASAVFAWLGTMQSAGDWVTAVQSKPSANDSIVDKKYHSVWGITTSPLWRRGWIQQELIVNREVYMMSEKGFVSICKLDTFLEQLHLDKTSPLWDKYPAMFLLRARRSWRGPTDVSLLQWLSRSGDCVLSDPRDHVFAFIGLADPGYNITANYSKSCSEVFEETAKMIITHDRSLSILALLDPSLWRKRITYFPSWTPDWSRLMSIQGHHSSAAFYTPETDSPPFRAAGNIQHDRDNTLDERLTLTVQGLWLAVIDPASLSRDKVRSLVSSRIDEFCRRSGTTINSPNFVDSVRIAPWEFASFNEKFGFRAALDWSRAYLSSCTGQFRLQSSWEQSLQHILHQLDSSWLTFRSVTGFSGLVHRDAMIGDRIVILFGCNVPLVLRPKNQYFELVGQAFVNGMMYGEAIEMMYQGKLTAETIQLV
jgi:Heterokaryon incompatibility protein (HET)